MACFSDLDRHVDALREVVGVGVEAADLAERLLALRDADVRAVIAETTAAIRILEAARIAASGVVAARSRRGQGHAGMAGASGHRNAVGLVQELTGGSRADAARQVRVGEALLGVFAVPGGAAEDPGPDAAGSGGVGPGAGVAEFGEAGSDAADLGEAGSGAPPRLWHAVLGDRLLSGAVSAAQHDAILRGLGEPPADPDRGGEAVPGYAAAWAVAAEQLADEAGRRTVEELAATARTVRDRLDPAGAEARFTARFEARSFRMWVDADGAHRASVVFDDEMAAWVRTAIDSALRPRRGGPRFVDPEEKARADELVADPRTNDQLTYDLVMDTLRAGSLADPAAVFGTRQAGVRVVVTEAALSSVATARVEAAPAVAHTEDGIATIPAWIAAQRVCESGTRSVVLDTAGEPLRLGREHRLFTPAQRIALAVRDGGCRWTGCDRPASLCEAHHIDPFSSGGTTDVDRGILLCRFHHMNLHRIGARITRAGAGPFTLHPPPGSGPPTVLHPRLSVTTAWAPSPPPPHR